AGLHRPRERRRIGAEVPAERAPSHAKIPRLARATTLLEVDWLRLRQVRPAALHDPAVLVLRVDPVAHLLLDAVEVERRQELAVRHGLEVVVVAADTDELFYMRV